MQSRILVLGSVCGVFWMVGACGNVRPASTSGSPVLRPPVFDAEFRRIWNDGSAEVSNYETLRMRDGVPRRGTATAITRRAIYSEDERVPVESPKASETDLFPALQMLWMERYSEGVADDAEMTTSVVALGSVDGRVAGSATKADFSLQSWDGQLFHQLLFDATGVRSHQYSFFETEGDEQITLSYPGDGIAGDALWLWARHAAAPALNSGERRDVLLLPRLRNVRMRRLPLVWAGATLSRSAEAAGAADTFLVRRRDGSTESFVVERVSPFRVRRWEDSRGESADLISTKRLKSWKDLVPALHSSIRK